MSLLDSLRQILKVTERQFAAAVTPIRELDLGTDDFGMLFIIVSTTYNVQELMILLSALYLHNSE